MSYDTDAQAYFTAVESAGSSFDLTAIQSWLTADYVKYWVNDFVRNAKLVGVWDGITHGILLRCASSLTGALVPLKGTAPTNVSSNFVAADYNGQTGLKGNGSNKSLNSNVNANAFSQDDFHMAFWQSEADTRTGLQSRIFGTSANPGACSIYWGTGNTALGFSQSGGANPVATRSHIGLVGHARTASSAVRVTTAASGSTNAITSTSTAPINEAMQVFGIATQFTDARIAWYSFGPFVNLDFLNACLTVLDQAMLTERTIPASGGPSRPVNPFTQQVIG